MAEPVLTIRTAKTTDLDAVLNLLWDDPQGRPREDLSDEARPRYLAAFQEIERDDSHCLLVALADGQVAGCAQVSILPGLSYRGIRRALIEDVRVSSAERGKGFGRQLIDAACQHAADAGCEMIELFVHQDRGGAHQFYRQCGFEDLHRGFRKRLTGA